VIDISSCPVCERPADGCRAAHVRPDDRLLACPDCGLLFADRQREPAELEEMHRRQYYDEEATRREGRTAWGVLPDEAPFAPLRRAIIRRYPELGRPGTRVLDYGCGVGQFLKVMADGGAECLGVEPSPAAAGFVRERLGIEVVTGAEEALAGLPDGGFDLAALLNVLEHLRGPREVMSLVLRKLRPGGVACLFTPWTASLAYRLRRGGWANVRNPAHLALYSGPSLFLLLANVGFVNARRLVFWGGRPGFGPIRSLLQYFARLVGLGSGVFVTAERPGAEGPREQRDGQEERRDNVTSARPE
jgi:2-polyprenyl-3-methyl-5-hydroxy-6-metoxy-1,4-benzoquinol methylase